MIVARSCSGASASRMEIAYAQRVSAFTVLLAAAITACAACGHSIAPTAPTANPVTYSATGTAKAVEISYTLPIGVIRIAPHTTLPFTFSWAVANVNDVLLLSAQVETEGDPGTVHVSILKNGVEFLSDSAAAFPNTAEVHGRY